MSGRVRIGERHALDVECPTCGATPGRACVRVDGGYRTQPHQSRQDAARIVGPTLTGTCSLGHVLTVPDKGMGRATLAAWETQHQHNDDREARQ